MIRHIYEFVTVNHPDRCSYGQSGIGSFQEGGNNMFNKHLDFTLNINNNQLNIGTLREITSADRGLDQGSILD